MNQKRGGARFARPFLAWARAAVCVLAMLIAVGMLAAPMSCGALGAGGGPPTLFLRASRPAVLNDGRDSIVIMAEVREGNGAYASDGTTVAFATNLGYFEQGGATASAGCRAGTARVRLSGNQKGTATITATVPGGGFGTLDVTITDDPAETFQGNTYASVTGTGSLVYSAGDRLIEARGKPTISEQPEAIPGAHLRFRAIEVFAEVLQLDCSSTTLRAAGRVTLVRGKHRLNCGKLFYNITNGDGYAVVDEGRALMPVRLKGVEMRTERAENGVPPLLLEMTDLAEARLIVIARGINLFPGEKLQFKKPRFYQDGQQVLSLGFYSLPLYSNLLFTDQFVSVGSQGLGLDVPLYYDLSPGSSGIARVRYGEQVGTSTFARRPGWMLDLTQSYNSTGGTKSYTGEFGLTGINRADWGARWTHSMELSSGTRASVYLDVPQHSGVYASTNVSQRLGPLHIGVNVSANQSFKGPATSGTVQDAYVETLPRKVARTGYMMAVSASVGSSSSRSGDVRASSRSKGLNARFYSKQVRLGRDTTLSNTITLGHVWNSTGRSGANVMTTITASRRFTGSSFLDVTYDYSRQGNSIIESGSHRLAAGFRSNGRRFSFMLMNSVMLDAPSSSLYSLLDYQMARRWRLALSASAQRYAGVSYQDLELGVAHDLGGRDLYLGYSTYNHRIMFDLQATRF